MAKAVFLAWANPSSAETEAEFNSWYDEVHVPEVRAAVPSITVVNRYRVAAPGGVVDGRAPVHGYLAVYEMDSDDCEAAAAALNAGIGGGSIVLSPTLDLVGVPPVLAWFTHV